MEIRYPILRHVRDLTGSAVDNALLAAVDMSDAVDQEPLVDVLLARSTNRGLGGLVVRFHELTPTAQRKLIERIDSLVNVLRNALKSPQRRVRLNAMRLVASTQRPRLAFLAVLGLVDSDPDVSGQAAGCLVDYMKWYASDEPPVEPGSDAGETARARYAEHVENRVQLVRALQSMLENYESHRRDELVAAALPLGNELAAVFTAALADGASPLGRVLADMLVADTEPHAATLLYLALSRGESRVRAAGRIASLLARPLLVELIRQVHRLDDVDTAVGFRLIRRMSFFEHPGWWEHVPDELADQTIRFIDGLGADDNRKLEWLSAIVADGSPVQRSAALDRLSKWDDAEATEALKRLVDHPDPEVAGQAAAVLAPRKVPGLERVMAAKLNHPSERLRQVAAEQVAEAGFEKFWEQYSALQPEVQQFAARKLRRMLDDLADRLSAKLAHADPEQRLQAVRVIDLCDLVEPALDALLARGQDPDARVRSAMIKLLGRVRDAQAEQVVTAALADPDRRVRANAIEALEMMHAEDCAARLSEMIESRDNRIRANAIKALMGMKLPTARSSLHTMLSDPSPEHRVSALWVVEQMQWMRTAEIVLRLAQQDPERRVRQRALQTLGELRRIYRATRAAGARTTTTADAPAAAPAAR